MMHRITSNGAAAVSSGTKWLPIDDHTPRGVKLQLINERYGVAQYGPHRAGDTYFTHWCPLPTFEE
jgi:hypothetical protein